MTLVVSNLKKTFGQHVVFKDVNFSIQKGDIATIEGKSGEGKTTLLRCINDLERVNQGAIKIDDLYLCKDGEEGVKYADKSDLKEIHQKIGMVFQQFNLFPHMTVMENLLFAPKYLKMDEQEANRRAETLLAALEIDSKKESLPHQLSGGQKQRVAIARACMLNPTLLCFDEPTSALDKISRDQIVGVIRYLSEKGIEILIVSHDTEFIDEISSRKFLLKNKNLIEIT